jgi:hypothetical protein
MKMSKVINARAYAAVRRVISHGELEHGTEYIDNSTIRCDARSTSEAAGQGDAQLPIWAGDNPVVRIIAVEIREVV